MSHRMVPMRVRKIKQQNLTDTIRTFCTSCTYQSDKFPAEVSRFKTGHLGFSAGSRGTINTGQPATEAYHCVPEILLQDAYADRRNHGQGRTQRQEQTAHKPQTQKHTHTKAEREGQTEREGTREDRGGQAQTVTSSQSDLLWWCTQHTHGKQGAENCAGLIMSLFCCATTAPMARKFVATTL